LKGKTIRGAYFFSLRCDGVLAIGSDRAIGAPSPLSFLLPCMTSMKDRDGLKSAISCGHGQRKGREDHCSRIILTSHMGSRSLAPGTGQPRVPRDPSRSAPDCSAWGQRRETERRGAILPVPGQSMPGMMSDSMRTVQSYHDQKRSHRCLSIESLGEIRGLIFWVQKKRKMGTGWGQIH